MKNFDIVLFRGTSLIARLIRIFIHERYNHAGIYFEGYIFESDKNGVKISDVNQKQEKMVLRLKDEFVFDNFNTVLASRMLKFGASSKYDYKNLLIKQPFYRIFGKWFGESKQTEKRLTCTEYVARIYMEFFENPEKVSPKEIINNKYFEKIILDI